MEVKYTRMKNQNRKYYKLKQGLQKLDIQDKVR